MCVCVCKMKFSPSKKIWGLKGNRMTNTKQNTHTHTHTEVCSSLKGLHSLGAKLKAIFNLVRNRSLVRAVTLRQWFSSLVCRYSIRSDIVGDKRNEDRGQIQLLSVLFCPFDCLFVISQLCSFLTRWGLRWFYDPFFNYINSLIPLPCNNVATVRVSSSQLPISFRRHILLYSLKILYKKNRTKGEWKDRISKRINWKVPRGNRGNTNLTWSKILLNKNIILNNIERRRYKNEGSNPCYIYFVLLQGIT